ncbi:response regulator [Aminiphilus circumscriptus]|jgi:CheY-like chemotaxis protein|uniref:response regulator n=1 Tax=Aminiphilus circumscriptus TaxID=290732 RepID=UPI0004785D78|nr:response regulator [Aminiphilus circumscriptus]
MDLREERREASPPRVLVVEDEVLTALDLQACLERAGYRVVDIVFSGEDAVRRAKELQPDLVLMDISLKGDLGGIEAARLMQGNGEVSVIFLTAHTDQETLARAKALAPRGFLTKPFMERDLLDKLAVARE